MRGSREPRQPRRPPTIFDVAAVAGVSKSTVSNVVRGVENVSAATRERVLAAIERFSYKPNAIARQFVQQRTTMLGVLLGDLSNPYYAQMAQVVERAAFSFGYTTMFCNIEGAEEIAMPGVEALLEHRVAGIVFLAFVAHPSSLGNAAASGCRSCSSGSASTGATPWVRRIGRVARSLVSICCHSAIAVSPTCVLLWWSLAATALATPATAPRCSAPALRRCPSSWTPGSV